MAQTVAMTDSVEIGMASTATYTVTEDMSPPHLPVKVLSTPNMVGLIEETCLKLVQEHLGEGQTTVGIHVCVSHEASVSAGENVHISCELTDRDRKKLGFIATVISGDKTISKGTHDRFIIET